MRLMIELNRDVERLFTEVLGTDDPQATADDIHEIILAEFEWNNKYTAVWRKLANPEWFVYPANDV